MNELTLDTQDTENLIIDVRLIGQSQTPILCIDDFYPAPDNLIQQATEGSAFVEEATDFYPGKRKTLNDAAYHEYFLKHVGNAVRHFYPHLKAFSSHVLLSTFSITTTQPQQLRPIQTIPHIDTHDDKSFASVHYLCNPPFAGTSFYRHKQTGIERMQSDQLKSYFAVAKDEVKSSETLSQDYQPAYCNGSTRHYELIHRCPLQFNRLVVYPSNLLHSGDIQAGLLGVGNPQRERLTLNTFFNFSD